MKNCGMSLLVLCWALSLSVFCGADSLSPSKAELKQTYNDIVRYSLELSTLINSQSDRIAKLEYTVTEWQEKYAKSESDNSELLRQIEGSEKPYEDMANSLAACRIELWVTRGLAGVLVVGLLTKAVGIW